MAKNKINVPSVTEAVKMIKSGKIPPVIFLFGEDSSGIASTLKLIEKKSESLIENEFNKEQFYGEDRPLEDIIGFASAFPFGEGKKLIIYKEFEKVKDKKPLAQYAKSPADFTILIIIHSGGISNPDTEPYRSLAAGGYIFEAKELKGEALAGYLIEYAASYNYRISRENAGALMDITGEDKGLLEAQLEKIFTFLGDEKEITLDSINKLAAALKEYTIFDLQNALGKKDKKRSLKIADNLVSKGAEATYIIAMLTRYYTALARINELKEQKMPDFQAARIVGTHPFYLKDYYSARNNYSDEELQKAARLLLEADTAVKTTSAGTENIVPLLIAGILT